MSKYLLCHAGAIAAGTYGEDFTAANPQAYRAAEGHCGNYNDV